MLIFTLNAIFSMTPSLIPASPHSCWWYFVSLIDFPIAGNNSVLSVGSLHVRHDEWTVAFPSVPFFLYTRWQQHQFREDIGAAVTQCKTCSYFQISCLSFFLSFLPPQNFSVLESTSLYSSSLPIKFTILSRGLKNNSAFLKCSQILFGPNTWPESNSGT